MRRKKKIEIGSHDNNMYEEIRIKKENRRKNYYQVQRGYIIRKNKRDKKKTNYNYVQ